MALELRPDDPRLTWQGAISLERSEEWVMPWRIPYEEKELFPPVDGVGMRAAMAAGVRLAFRSDTTRVAGGVVPFPEKQKIDLCSDGELRASLELGGGDGFAFDDLPEGEKLVELWLPQYGTFRLKSLALSDGASVAPFDDTRPKWVTYGSSITHCIEAESPAQTWPAIVARGRGLNLTCLGYGGQCHLDPMIARMIRDLPADLISICCGINICGASSMSPRTFKPAVIGTVKTIREKHPTTPLALISPILSPPYEKTENAVGFTLEQIRLEIEDAVRRLKRMGDDNLHYVSGLDLLGLSLADFLLDDGVHPSSEGYKHMGRNFLEKVIPQVFP